MGKSAISTPYIKNVIRKTIEEWQKNGWRLHTYQTAGMGAGPMAYKVSHYLLFEKGE